jgi:peroxiredoxin Q/BCP
LRDNPSLKSIRAARAAPQTPEGTTSMPTKITKSTTKSPAPAVKPAAKPKPVAKVKAIPPATGNQRTAVAAHPLEGKPAPAFSLTAQNGATLSLKDLTAKGNLVLYFYPKDLTPGCTTQACDFRDHQAELRKAGAEVVGVSGDSASLHDRFIAKHELNFPLLSDPGNEVSKAFGVYVKKSLYGREYMGIERTTFIIDRKGIIRRVFPKVKVKDHAEAVLAAIHTLD